MLQELQRQQQLDQQHAQILRAAATDEDLRIFPPINNMVNTSQQQSVSANIIQPITSTVIATTTTMNTVPMSITNHQTPSSPDDESGKSSYEAISKMLNMLRSSTNVSDSSEISESDQSNKLTMDDSNKLKQKGAIEYSLVPILVDGIDYTKYKLLSQYEPKFKNDPRLNQQT